MLIKYEKLKTYILFALALISLIQLGALWDVQTQGLPFQYISGKFGIVSRSTSGDPSDISILKNTYFSPFRMTASKGNNAHWVLNGEDYLPVWEEARGYLAAALSGKPVDVYASDDWGSLGFKKSFMFEFKEKIPAELVGWLLDIRIPLSNKPATVEKFLIQPFDDAAECPVYIHDGSSIYKYSVPIRNGDFGVSYFDSIIAGLEENQEIKAFGIVKELNLDVFDFRINPDILCLTRSSFIRFESCDQKLPMKLSDDADEMADRLLGNDKDGYDRSRDMNDNMAFTGLYNSYRLYADGLLEYRYLPGTEGADKGSIIDAYLNAVGFIDHLKSRLIPSSSISLASAAINGDSYRFTFDYKVKGFPVVTDCQSASEEDRLVDAISVESNSRRLLECTWLLRDLEQNNDGRLYNMNVDNLLGSLDDIYKPVKNDLSVEDMYAAYVIGDSEEVMDGRVFNIVPSFVFEKTDGTNYIIPMSAKDE